MQWSPVKEAAKYFEPSINDFIMSHRAIKLGKLLEKLRTISVLLLLVLPPVIWESYIYNGK